MDESPVPGQEAPNRSRRNFLQAVVGVFSTLIGLFLAIPFIAAFIGSARRAEEREPTEVGGLDALPVGEPVELVFREVRGDAFVRRELMHHIWAVRTSGSEVTVFSPICPHLGCAFGWDARAAQFRCPCHASAYTIDGRVIAGPAPRPLDTLPAEIRQGRLFVRWEQYRPGVAGKIRV